MRHKLRRWSVVALLLLGGALLELAGAVLPWVPHRTAALSFNAPDLFVVVRLLPPVRDGFVPVWREAFLLPVLASALMVAWLPAPRSRTPRPWRFPVSLAGAALALSLLPPYPAVLTAYRDPVYRGQFLLSVGGFALALAGLLTARLPRRAQVAVGALLAAVGWVPAAGMFLRVRPLFAALYGAPVGLGPGFFLTGVGAALGIGALAAALWPRREEPSAGRRRPADDAHPEGATTTCTGG